ncbi:hypothetical protein [Actinoalloteichus sp. GBA129-24]|uniref:hypothetical protein n=1 Tax=Actinoalloteichus sp. GBA129-24 TaxID=1612551 RepID=UPI000951DCCD|nr:hypothetical protein [Actinoalloteichus sp. GBA129-24]
MHTTTSETHVDIELLVATRAYGNRPQCGTVSTTPGHDTSARTAAMILRLDYTVNAPMTIPASRPEPIFTA